MTKRLLPALLLTFALLSGIAGAQTVIPTSRPHQNFVDQSGVPCSGCSLYSYNAGTTTPTPTFTDNTGGSQNPNPIILDAAGGASIWLGANAGNNYKFLLCEGLSTAPGCLLNGGAIQWTADQVPANPVGTFLPLTGGAISGNLTIGGNESVAGTFSANGPWSLAGYGSLGNLSLLQYFNNANPQLAGWLFSLPEAATQPINVVIVGDSQTICYNALTSCATGPNADLNRWAELLRITLQGLFGSHGTGLVPVMAGVSNSVVNNQYWTISGAVTKSTILGPSQTSTPATGSSLVQLANAEVLTFLPTQQSAPPIPFDKFIVYCMTNSGSGSIAVAIDGVGVGTACGSTTGSATAHAVSFTASTGLGVHSVTLTSTGTSYVYGGEGTAGTTGVSVHNLATASALAEYFGGAPATQLAFSDLIGTTASPFTAQQQLLIVDLGTNNANPAFGSSSSTYSTAVQAILTHEAGLTGAPSVLIVQPPVSNVATSGVWATYTAALSSVVAANTVAYANIQSQWGTTFNAVYFCADGIHPCDAGSRDEAAQIIPTVLPYAPGLAVSQLAQSMTIQSGPQVANPFFNATCAGACDTGLSIQPVGEKQFFIAGWGLGLTNGLPGVVGLFDSATSGGIYPWNSNASDDFCLGTLVSGGNVAGCTGAGFHYTPANLTLTLNNLAVQQLVGAQAVTIGACTGTNGSNTFNCPGGNTAGTGAQASCFTTGGNQCTLLDGLISITTGTGAGLGDIIEVKTTGSATAHALNCQLTGAGTGTLPLTSTSTITVDESSVTNGQFQIAALSAPTSSHQFLVFYSCTQ